jgi:hypothetical protein
VAWQRSSKWPSTCLCIELVTPSPTQQQQSIISDTVVPNPVRTGSAEGCICSISMEDHAASTGMSLAASYTAVPIDTVTTRHIQTTSANLSLPPNLVVQTPGRRKIDSDPAYFQSNPQPLCTGGVVHSVLTPAGPTAGPELRSQSWRRRLKLPCPQTDPHRTSV